MPKRVTIELTNRCNRNCEGCPRRKMTYPLGDMSISLFTKVTSQLNGNVCIVPFYRGESTLHPHFPELMSQLSHFSIVQLATNGDFLTKTTQKAILENCTFISLSLHELKFPKETSWLPFLYNCLGADLETQVSIIDSELLETQKQRFIKEWSRHVNRVRIYAEHSQNGFGSLPNQSCIEPCSKPFEEMVVYWDGKVGLCNHDWNNLTLVGDLNKQSIAEVWNSSEYETVRKLHLANNRKQVETCKHCGFNPKKVTGEILCR